jgi:hypothetical protein
MPESIRGTSTPVWKSESPSLLPSTLLVNARVVKAQYDMTCSRFSFYTSSNKAFPVEIPAVTDKGEFWQVNDWRYSSIISIVCAIEPKLDPFWGILS